MYVDLSKVIQSVMSFGTTLQNAKLAVFKSVLHFLIEKNDSSKINRSKLQLNLGNFLLPLLHNMFFFYFWEAEEHLQFIILNICISKNRSFYKSSKCNSSKLFFIFEEFARKVHNFSKIFPTGGITSCQRFAKIVLKSFSQSWLALH